MSRRPLGGDSAPTGSRRSLADDAPATPEGAGPSELLSLGRGAAQGATLGFDDEIMGLIQAALPVSGDAPDFATRYRKERDARRRELAAAEKAHGGYYLGGQIAGGTAPALLAAMAAGPVGVAGRLAQGTGLGAAQGAGGSEATTVGGLAKDTGIGAGVGLATGGVAEGVAKAVPAVAYSLGNKFLNNTTGRISAKNALSKEAVEAAYESGAIRPWKGIQGASETLEAARNEVGGELGQVLRDFEKAGGVGFDKQNLAAELTYVGTKIKEGSYSSADYQPYFDAAKKLLTKPSAPGTNNIPVGLGESLKRTAQQEAEAAYKALPGTRPSGTAKAWEGIAARHRTAMEQALDQQRALAPDAVEAFIPLKMKYGPLAEAYSRAAEGAARSAGRGLLGLPEAVMLASHGPGPATAVKAGRMFLPQLGGSAAWGAKQIGLDAAGQNPVVQSFLRTALVDLLRRKKEEE